MVRDEPAWWYGAGQQSVARALQPLAHLYGAVALARYRNAQPYRSKRPVICVGNFTAGGTGKTPLALYIAERLKAMGERPVFLTRGYGGSLKGPVWVDGARHTASDIGDEPLLLVRAAPVVVARDRKAGAQEIEARGRDASVIIMDDGLQNPSLIKDLAIAVVDAARGIGNGRVIPAGPLRAPLEFQMALCDAIVLNGAGRASPIEDRLQQTFTGPLLRARVEPAQDTAWLDGARLIAFAGIGHPQRFFDLLGPRVHECVVFRDHQMLNEGDACALLAKAKSVGATLITTEKDWVRLTAVTGPLAELKKQTRAFAVRSVLDVESRDRLDQLLNTVLVVHGAKP